MKKKPFKPIEDTINPVTDEEVATINMGVKKTSEIE
jgi:hypothetical protein